MGSDLMIFEVRPEKGKGHSRVLHRNLLMSCDHLPFETQPEVTNNYKINRKEGTHMCHSQKTQMKSVEMNVTFIMSQFRSTHHQQHLLKNMLSKRDILNMSLNTVEQRVELAVPVAMPTQPLIGDQPEELITPENVSDEEMNVPAKNLPDSPDASPASSAAEPEELTYQLPQSERHPPRHITYDQLGTPSCYSIQPQPQLLPFYPAPGLVPWLPPLQPYYLTIQPSATLYVWTPANTAQIIDTDGLLIKSMCKDSLWTVYTIASQQIWTVNMDC
ncbi:uncharacterized protein LOC128619929 [Ictalurus furcatus]|uniref:uncharacterized protein LOC128619929 n=1 Tax=Ictalurus furcatus TaxID=66913 RepID=UPI0023503A00|nr:uncharacterized protein LOC128619929 [Ictalurus furcatus]